MKKMFIAALACALAVFTGCKSIPEKETVGQKAYAAGLAAGYASALIPKITAQDKTNAVVIVTIAERFIPQDGQTFEQAWTPVIQEAITKLIAQGKVTEEQAVLVKMAADLGVKGIDYLFIKHPKWRQEQDVFAVAIHEACNGFRTGIGINPNNQEVVDLVNSIMDKETFKLCAPAR